MFPLNTEKKKEDDNTEDHPDAGTDKQGTEAQRRPDDSEQDQGNTKKAST